MADSEPAMVFDSEPDSSSSAKELIEDSPVKPPTPTSINPQHSANDVKECFHASRPVGSEPTDKLAHSDAQASKLRRFTYQTDTNNTVATEYDCTTGIVRLGEASSLGVFLFLKFQRLMIYILILLAISKVYPWYLNSQGNRCEPLDTNSNIEYSSSDSSTSIDCADSWLIDWSLENCTDDQAWFGSGTLSQQLFEVSIWLGALWYASNVMVAECHSHDQAHRSPQDFALLVRHLPESTTTQQLKQHFTALLAAEGGPEENKAKLGCFARAQRCMLDNTVGHRGVDDWKRASAEIQCDAVPIFNANAVHDVELHDIGAACGNKMDESGEDVVAEVHLLVDLDGLMDKYRAWERISVELRWPIVERTDEEITKLQQEQDELMLDIKAEEKSRKESSQLAGSHEAIVVFRLARDAQRVIMMHNTSDKESPATAFGDHDQKVKVNRAPAPGMILWEYQQTATGTRIYQRVQGYLFMLLAVCIGGTIVWCWENFVDHDDTTIAFLIVVGSAYISGIINRLNKLVAIHFTLKERPRTADYLVQSMLYKMCMSYLGVFTLTYVILKGREDQWYSSDGLVVQGIVMMAINPWSYSSILSFQTVLRTRSFIITRVKENTPEQLHGLFAPPDLNLGEAYAKVIHTIGLGMVWAPAWPPAYLLSTISLFVLYWSHKIGISKNLHKPAPLDGRTVFAAFKVMHLYVLVHIIMAYVFIDRFQYYTQIDLISTTEVSTKWDSDYDGHGGNNTKSVRVKDESKHGKGRDQADETAIPLLVISLLLWLLTALFGQKGYDVDNTQHDIGVESNDRFPANAQEKHEEDCKARCCGSWEYSPPSSDNLEQRFEAFAEMCEANGLSGCRDGTMYVPDYKRSLDGTGSPVTLS